MKLKNFNKFMLFTIILITFTAYSCASYVKIYPLPINIKSMIEQGDTVKIVTKDNEEIQLKVKEVTLMLLWVRKIKFSIRIS